LVDELRRDAEEPLERRDDADLVRLCPELLRPLAAVRRRDDEERLDRELDELFLRDLELELRVAIVSSLLHFQTMGCRHGLRCREHGLYRSSSTNVEFSGSGRR
jgi:hypothetical protein